jgi:hypothetical protein
MSVARAYGAGWAIAGLIAVTGCDRPRPPPPVSQDVPLSGESADRFGLDPDAPEARLLAQDWTGDLDGMLERRDIRVLVIPDKMNLFFDGNPIRGITTAGRAEVVTSTKPGVGK